MITILLIRHGLAEDPRRGLCDEERSLTTQGWKRTRAAMKGLVARGYVPTRAVSSPYRRAVETLQCLQEAAQVGFPVDSWEGLLPQGHPSQAEDWLRGACSEASTLTLALVSHQPFCSDLILHLTGQEVAFPNAACAVLHFEGGRFSLAAHLKAAERWEGL